MLYHLALLFSTLSLSSQKFYLKVSKCLFSQETYEYLEHIISSHGVALHKTKVEAILKWPLPSSVKQLRGFLGLTGFYCRFIKSYASLPYPSTELLKKDSSNGTQRPRNHSIP